VILRRIARNAALLVAVLIPGALGLACPAKDLDIAITKRGSAFLTLACTQHQNCADKTHVACLKAGACIWEESACVGRCRIPDNPPATFDGLHDMQILLFSSNPANLRKRSACVAVAPCTSDDVVSCLESSLNDAITRSLGETSSDLTFDGFESTADGFGAVAIFERPTTSDGSEPPSCVPERLVACAGLDVPLNETKLDIECASCQGGQRTAVGESTRPCPADLAAPEGCFLRTCFAQISN
jgi:hypothetical protein